LKAENECDTIGRVGEAAKPFKNCGALFFLSRGIQPSLLCFFLSSSDSDSMWEIGFYTPSKARLPFPLFYVTFLSRQKADLRGFGSAWLCFGEARSVGVGEMDY
jgi:hypothetical protein